MDRYLPAIAAKNKTIKPSTTLFRNRFALLALLTSLFFATNSFAQVQDTLSASQLKMLSLEELMNIEVISVSKRSQKLTQTASAIQVISNADIRRSGAKTVAEALQLASNLQVAQVNASQWAISSRGFNNVLANKLLVLIDGRTVYTPMYAGVFWDVQNLLLDNIDRIEVISGPGGTLWGANAVNGVINVITKNAADTKGLFAEVGYGENLHGLASVRYGGSFKKDFDYRVYATGFRMGASADTLGHRVNDDWSMAQGGFRTDYKASEKSTFSFQANAYDASPNPDGTDSTSVTAQGFNAVIRWNRQNSERSHFQLQSYFDYTWRDFGTGFTEDLKTYDLDAQNRNEIGIHTFIYGVGARILNHKVSNLETFGFFPGYKTLYVYNIFAQYEVMLIKEKLRLTVGSKAEYNNYTKFQHQPSGRLTWTPSSDQTIWAAVSRAVRNPSRIDRDFALFLPSGIPYFISDENFKSEIVVAHEIGWRVQPAARTFVSIAAFYNNYDNLRSAEPANDVDGFPIIISNGVEGNSYGVEVSANYQLAQWWNLRGGYTFLEKDLRVKRDRDDLNNAIAESNDPAHQFLLQSNIILPHDLEFGTVLRCVDKLPQPYLKGYTGLDLRLGWNANKNFELSIVGQNLLHDRTTEFIASSPKREIQRTIYGRITCRF